MITTTVEGITILKCMCGSTTCRYCEHKWNACNPIRCPNCNCNIEKPIDSQQFIAAVLGRSL